MKFSLSLLIPLLLLVPGSARAQSASSPALPAARPAAAGPDRCSKRASAASKKATIVVPRGTKIPLVLENAVSTRSAHAGDPVYFQTLFPILVGSRIVIPAGSYVSGELLSVKRPGRIRGRGRIMLKLSRLILPNGYTVSLAGTPSDVGTGGGGEKTDKEGRIQGPTSRTSDAGVILRSTIYGAAIGGASGGLNGARSGMGIGSVAGLLGVLLTRGPDARLPRGTTMDATLDHPLSLLASRVRFKTPGHAPQLGGPPDRGPRRRATPF